MSGKLTCLCRLLITFRWKNYGHEVVHVNKIIKQSKAFGLKWFSVGKFYRSSKCFHSSNFVFHSASASGFLLFFSWKAKELLWWCWFPLWTFEWCKQHNASVIAIDLFKVQSKFLRQKGSILLSKFVWL